MKQELIQVKEEDIQKKIDENKGITSVFIHELRNPLSLMSGTLQYIEMKHPEAREYKYWSQLFELIKDMDNMMSEASILNSRSSLIIKSSDLLSAIQLVIDSYMPQAENQEKLLLMKVKPECQSLISSYPCDSDKIKQVLSNLLKNAFEATSAGDFIEVILSVDTIDNNPMIKIQISNNGMPIPEDEIDTIFLPFVTHKVGGTGVGLALSKLIIEKHLGSISVTSSDKLTEFTILLPIVAGTD